MIFQWRAEKDMHDVCFICGLPSYDFEHHTKVSVFVIRWRSVISGTMFANRIKHFKQNVYLLSTFSIILNVGTSMLEHGLSVCVCVFVCLRVSVYVSVCVPVCCYNIEYKYVFQGFYHHTHYEHNMWTYIYYFIYLSTTNRSEYTALDYYVADQVR